ncbi:MAG TPA: ribonuclease domain-containing protein [Erysipelothrix sp.]|nr:ribonuclease domain-containing protein [Erysipelothrix sp.]
MNKNFKKNLLSALIFVLLFSGYVYYDTQKDNALNNSINQKKLIKDGYYTSKEDVSLYIHLYETLPENYITKQEAIALGWKASEGNLWDVSDQKSIGGDAFRNREKKLPQGNYFEADIDYKGGYRNEKRVVYSSEGDIYYTDDHYTSFEKLYGDD